MPSLQLSDIPRQASTIPTDVAACAGATLLTHDLFTNNVLYAEAALDLRGVPARLLPLVPLFCRWAARLAPALASATFPACSRCWSACRCRPCSHFARSLWRVINRGVEAALYGPLCPAAPEAACMHATAQVPHADGHAGGELRGADGAHWAQDGRPQRVALPVRCARVRRAASPAAHCMLPLVLFRYWRRAHGKASWLSWTLLERAQLGSKEAAQRHLKRPACEALVAGAANVWA